MKENIKTNVQDSLQTVGDFEVEDAMLRLCNAAEGDLTIVNKISVLFLAYKYSTFESFAETEADINKNIVDESTKEKLLQTLEKFHKAVDELSRIYRRKELKKALVDLTPRRIFDREFADLPDGVSKLVLALLDIKDGEKFFNLNAGTFKLAMSVAAANEKISVCGTCETQNSLYLGNIRSAVVDNRIEVKFANILETELVDIQADKVFVNPERGRVLSRDILNNELNNFCERICCKEWAYTVAGILNQKPGGLTVAILPENVLVNEADKDTRQSLLESGKIEGIISLHPFSGLQHNLVIFSENNTTVKMLDARKFFTDAEKSTLLSDDDITEILRRYNDKGENYIEVPNDKIAANNYVVYPARYLIEKKIDFDGEPFSNFIKSIQRGALQVRPPELEKLKSKVPTDYQFLNIQDITETGISENLTYLKKEAYTRYKRNFVSAGDIVISRLYPFKVSLIPDTDKKIFISENLYALKVADNINAIWLLLCLKSPKILMQLNAMASGGTSRIINPRELEKIKIPKVSLENQNEIAKKYSALKSEIENLNLKIENIRAEIKNLNAF